MNNDADKTIVLDQPEQIAMARILTLRTGLRLETRGMKMGRGPSALSILRREGIVKSRTAVKALEELNAILSEHGL